MCTLQGTKQKTLPKRKKESKKPCTGNWTGQEVAAARAPTRYVETRDPLTNGPIRTVVRPFFHPGGGEHARLFVSCVMSLYFSYPQHTHAYTHTRVAATRVCLSTRSVCTLGDGTNPCNPPPPPPLSENNLIHIKFRSSCAAWTLSSVRLPSCVTRTLERFVARASVAGRTRMMDEPFLFFSDKQLACVLLCVCVCEM